ncbi:MAG: winged helix-turn-helix domain-containing protein [Pseudomonadota bacterium]
MLLIAGAADWVENLVRQLRERGDAMPIVVLNDRLQNGENARILDAGADDCLACPFDSAELRARVRAIMRRRSGDLTRDLEIGADFETLRIRVRDVDARVSRKQFEIFLLLAERREHWVHSDEIIAAVSGTHHDPASSVVRVQIHALRKAVGAARECIRCDGHKSYMLSLATG